jgi:proteasome lid subunit RPN8/RPN11
MLEFRILFPRCGKVIRPHREAPISKKERRRHPREACNILVDYTLKERVFRGFILNISRGGALISNGRPVLVGEEVKMVFRHPFLKEIAESPEKLPGWLRRELG